MMNNLFWGILILLFGLSMVVKALFGFTFPIMKPLIGLLFIYIGFVMIFNLGQGRNVSYGRSFVQFGNAHFKDTYPARKYSIVFGKGTIDLSGMEVPTKPIHTTINTVFGKSSITLNKNIPTQIKLNSVFSDTELPYNHIQQTSSNMYQIGDPNPLLFLDINVVFGKTLISAP